MTSPHDPTDPPTPALAALAIGMRRLREQAGLSQRALAEQMSYVREYVTLAERGRRLPSREFLVRYAHALDATERLLPLYDAAWREDQAIRRAARVRRYQQQLGVTEHDAARLDGMVGPYVTKLDRDMQRRLFIQALLATGGAVLAPHDGQRLVGKLPGQLCDQAQPAHPRPPGAATGIGRLRPDSHQGQGAHAHRLGCEPSGRRRPRAGVRHGQ
jgi:DNA-binding XRE family transcriptional regulator